MNNDDVHESEDDALEESRTGGSSMFHPATDEEKLAEDGDTPAAPAQGDHTNANPQDPQTDDKLDEDEVYSEGLAAAEDKNEEDSDAAPPKPLDENDES